MATTVVSYDALGTAEGASGAIGQTLENTHIIGITGFGKTAATLKLEEVVGGQAVIIRTPQEAAAYAVKNIDDVCLLILERSNTIMAAEEAGLDVDVVLSIRTMEDLHLLGIPADFAPQAHRRFALRLNNDDEEWDLYFCLTPVGAGGGEIVGQG